jgi:hypothetical protein
MMSPALAGPKWLPWAWGHDHWKNHDFAAPNLLDGKTPHNQQWNDEHWDPAVWIAQKGNAIALIEGFYKAGILTDQKMHKGVPYLYVGPQFYNLGGYDKRRVVETVDEVYGVTSEFTDDVFYLYDPYTRETIGMYTKHGLMIQ